MLSSLARYEISYIGFRAMQDPRRIYGIERSVPNSFGPNLSGLLQIRNPGKRLHTAQHHARRWLPLWCVSYFICRPAVVERLLGFGGTCTGGKCQSNGLLDTAVGWYQQNLQIAIPVTVVAGLLAIGILVWIFRGTYLRSFLTQSLTFLL